LVYPMDSMDCTTSQKMKPAMVAPKRINVGNQKVDGISERGEEIFMIFHDNHGYLMIVNDNYPQ